jgi:hypothetical protein
MACLAHSSLIWVKLIKALGSPSFLAWGLSWVLLVSQLLSVLPDFLLLLASPQVLVLRVPAMPLLLMIKMLPVPC